MSVLVLGATGALGRLVLTELRKRGLTATDITAAGRKKDVLDALAADGYRTAQVELGDAEQVRAAVTGHDQVVLISGIDPDRVQQHRHVIDAAKDAGVRHFYYTSGLRVDDPSYPLGADHIATEDAITASGLTYTIMRNAWYIENYIQAMHGAAQTGVFTAAVGDGRIAPASRQDLAEALAVTVTTDGHDDRTYHLSGDRDYTYHDIAAAMTEVLGTPVRYQPVTGEQYQAILTGAGVDEGTAAFLAVLDGNIGAGIQAHTGDQLTRLIGRRTTPLADGLRQNL
ncbi:SDR family oxidoreductase [Actinoplanes sichuanensis]|uniref:SDR family oxidoreductase n=1 Tax=Actinoplanes sichuanensis TaxID=512349 RepID=A0ABW4AN25_9ACTN|nr:SDR family oxidoreductase [Actinoplanes sichuanensis]BEL06287.1 SDR family oxidoreductase [Actinoplanes sichuanensis]